MQDFFARLCIAVCVALQHFVGFERVFERHERFIWLLFCTNEEDERFFLCKTQVILHPPDAVMQELSLTDKVCRRLCYYANKRASLVMLQGQVLFGNFAEFLYELLFLVCFFDCLLFRVLVYAYIVPSLKIFREQVLL